MIKFLQIENFKSLKNVQLGLGNLNLFFGCNGMGKSSVIQALLMLRQSYWRMDNLDTLCVNGDLVALGTASDILCKTTEDEFIRIYFATTSGIVKDCRYAYDSKFSDQLDVAQTIDDGYAGTLFGKQFHYLSAEHIGPRPYYSSQNWEKQGINPLGNNGEFVVPFLAKYGESCKVPQVMCLETGRTSNLIDQVAAWMGLISPGVKLNAILDPLKQIAELYISYDRERLVSERFSPVNVGFGISYVLPLIVVLLTSKEDSLLLLENPESHLHPKGQSAMGRLLALAAENGAQIICESHSDHIINGIRVAVKEESLENEKVMIAYFNKNENQETTVETILVDKKGELDCYPEGLLDEWGTLMSKLLF